MSARDRINDEIRESMKTKDQVRLNALRLMKTELAKAETEKGRQLTTDEELDVFKRMAKARNDSIALYRRGKRDDLADMEAAQLRIVEEFMPERISDAEMERVIDEALAEYGEIDPHQTTGMLMGRVMSKLKATGKTFDGRAASEKILERFKF